MTRPATAAAAIGVALALCATALGAPKHNHADWDRDGWIKKVGRFLNASEMVVACQIRTPEWRQSVLMGLWGTTRITVLTGAPKSDKQIDAEVMEILQAAKVEAALHAEFAAPSESQCDALKDSPDMQELDAAAKIGLLAGAVR